MARYIDFTEGGKQYRVFIQGPDVVSPEGVTVALFLGSHKLWDRLLAPGDQEEEAVEHAKQIAIAHSKSS